MKVRISSELEKPLLIQALKNLVQIKNLSVQFVEDLREPVDFELVPLSFIDPNEELPAVIEPRSGALRCFDCLVRHVDHVIPRLISLESLNTTIIHKAHDLDIRQAAYVITDSFQGLVSAAVCAQLGIQKIVLVDDDLDRSLIVTKILKRSYFGLDVKSITSDLITTQRQPGGIVINTVQLENNPVLLSDISYFNFVAQNGIIVDISREIKSSPLLKDVEEASLRSINGEELLIETLKACIQYLSPGLSVSDDEIALALKNPTSV